MLRLDPGPSRAPGDFCCSVPGCGWARQGVLRQTADSHMATKHPGMARGITRTAEAKLVAAARMKRVLSEEEKLEKKERHKARCRQYRQDVKTLRGMKHAPARARDEQEQDAGAALVLLSGLNAERPQGSLCVSTCCAVPVFASVVSGGCGERSVTGSTDPEFVDAAQVAITWASLHAGWLRARGAAICRGGKVERNGILSRSGLQGPQEDVVLSFMAPHAIHKGGTSAGACAALALVQWLLRPMQTRGIVSVTGFINLRGFLVPAEGIQEKAGHAEGGGAAMLIMSNDAYEEVAADDFASWPEDLQPYARSSLRQAQSMFEVLQHAFEGFQVTPSMDQYLLDSPRVSWGNACGLEGGGVLEVECCHVRPGSLGGLILTGCLTASMKEVVRQVVDIVRSMGEQLGREFGREGKCLSLTKLGHDLHIHVSNMHVGQTRYYLSYMAAVAVALVGLVVGRRSTEYDVAVLGEVTPDWAFRWEAGLQWGSADVAACRAQDIRRLIVPEDVRMDEAAWAAARAVEDDGRPCVDVVCVPRSQRIFPMLRAVLDRDVYGWSLWLADT